MNNTHQFKIGQRYNAKYDKTYWFEIIGVEESIGCQLMYTLRCIEPSIQYTLRCTESQIRGLEEYILDEEHYKHTIKFKEDLEGLLNAD